LEIAMRFNQAIIVLAVAVLLGACAGRTYDWRHGDPDFWEAPINSNL
jgi:hypothetical protein